MIYIFEDVKTMARSSVIETPEFTLKVGLHQESALSPYLFDLILIVENVKKYPPWSIMLADDIVLC